MLRYIILLSVFFLFSYSNSISYMEVPKNKAIDKIRINLLDQKKFEQNTAYSFGYSPSKNILVEINLDDNIKYISMNSALIENIEIYNENFQLVQKSGLKNNIKQVFIGSYLFSKEKIGTNKFYILCSSNSIPLNINLSFHETFKEVNDFKSNYQIFINLFFGFLIAMLIFNISLYIRIRDKIYLLYCVYLSVLIVHHLMYSGYFKYFIDNSIINGFILPYAPIFASMIILSYMLFIGCFFNLKQRYPKLYKSLMAMFGSLFIYTVLSIFTDLPIKSFRGIFYLIALFFTTYLVFYIVFYKKDSFQRDILPIVLGQLLVLISMILMAMISSGAVKLTGNFEYLVEYMLMLETILFSILLSNKIKNLQAKNKQIVNSYDELNHRISNNLQIIRSIVNVFVFKLEDKKIKEKIQIQLVNKIVAFIELYEIMGKKISKNEFETQKYLNTLINLYIKTYTSESQQINITREIDQNITINEKQAPYVAIIINEALTNCFKHSFKENQKDKEINISLIPHNSKMRLIVKDNGQKVKSEDNAHSTMFGLESLKSLIEHQLNGKLSFKKDHEGASLNVIW